MSRSTKKNSIPVASVEKTTTENPSVENPSVETSMGGGESGGGGAGMDFTMQGGEPVYTLTITGQLIDRTTLRTGPGVYIKIPPEWVPNDIFENDEYSIEINITRFTSEP